MQGPSKPKFKNLPKPDAQCRLLYEFWISSSETKIPPTTPACSGSGMRRREGPIDLARERQHGWGENPNNNTQAVVRCVQENARTYDTTSTHHIHLCGNSETRREERDDFLLHL